MRLRLLIAIIVILLLSLAGCTKSKAPAVNEPTATNESTVAVEPTAAPTRTPLPPNVQEDAEGNLIKPDGWPIQEIIPKETRRMTAAGKTRKGRTVIYNEVLITPEGRPIAQAAGPYSENGKSLESSYEWRISTVSELSGRDGKIFCYDYAASLFGRNGDANSAVATATSYRLCDYDGDGKYELNGFIYPLITIPDWVKSLPGDPATVNANANYAPDCGILCAK